MFDLNKIRMAKRVAFAGYMGVFICLLFCSPFALLALPWVLLIVTPFILVAMLAAYIFKKSIENNLIRWCLIVPLVVWIVGTSCSMLYCNNIYCQKHNLIERFLSTNSSDGYLFLVAAAIASALFYALTEKALAKSKS
jgi:hypothetical protein